MFVKEEHVMVSEEEEECSAEDPLSRDAHQGTESSMLCCVLSSGLMLYSN